MPYLLRTLNSDEAAGHPGGGGEFGLGQLGQQSEPADPAAESRKEGALAVLARVAHPAEVGCLDLSHGLGTHRSVAGSWTILSWRLVRSGRCLPAGSTSIVNTRRSVSPGVRRSRRLHSAAGKFGMNALLRGVGPPATGGRSTRTGRGRRSGYVEPGSAPGIDAPQPTPGLREPPSATQPSPASATAAPRMSSSLQRALASLCVQDPRRRPTAPSELVEGAQLEQALGLWVC